MHKRNNKDRKKERIRIKLIINGEKIVREE
jgi:hypothetical protein